MKYKCSNCGAEGVRLWRTVVSTVEAVELFCVACALDREQRHLEHSWSPDGVGRYLDSGCLGYLVAARPTNDGSFWGHTSGGEDSVAAWRALPFAPRPTAREQLAQALAERDELARGIIEVWKPSLEECRQQRDDALAGQESGR